MHRVLARQLKHHLGEADLSSLPEAVVALLETIEATYETADTDRRLLERSLDLTSTELLERNRSLLEDVARREELNLRMMRAREQLDAVFDAIPDDVFIMDREGTIQECRGRRSFGDVAGRRLDHLFPQLAGELPRMRDAVVERLQPASALFTAETTKEARRLDLRLVPGPGELLVGLLRDVTEAEQMRERLRVSDRMASVGTLAAGVAHEINNPLTYVMANLDFIRQRLAEALGGHAELEETQGALEEAIEGADRVRTIVQDLKTFSRAEDEPVQAVNLHEVLDSALNMARVELRTRGVVVRDYLAEATFVRGSASRLAQVFLNLVMNAAHALPVGRIDDHRVEVTTRRTAEGVEVIVEDSGPGVPEDALPRIFDPFFTTKGREGTGLGLSICHNIVTAFGGSIEAENRVEGGARFTVRLLASAPPSRRSSIPAKRAGKGDARARVLIIDDEPGVLRATRRVLRAHDVTCALGGAEGRAYLDGPELYDVVLCDLRMPSVTGVDLLLHARPEQRKRWVFVTGVTFTPELDNLDVPVLAKPYVVDELLELVEAYASS